MEPVRKMLNFVSLWTGGPRGAWLRSRLAEQQSLMTQVSVETRIMIATCVVLSAVILFGFHYPPGLDLAQHAHLFGVLAHFHDPAFGVGAFYDLQPVTPYLLTYAVATPLAWAFGALMACKLILFGIALATPLTLWRWLAAVGGEKGFAYFGFVLAFGYPFIWGFTSYSASLPVAFLCLEAWTRAQSGRFPRRTLTLAALLVALFFTHAITFVLVALTLGILTLCHPRTAFFRRASALAVAFVVSVGWYLGRGSGHYDAPRNFAGIDRLTLLFGAEFHIFEAYWAALAGLAVLAILAVALRPALATGIDRWLPMGLATVFLLAVPNVLMDTIFVGQRFAFLVHAFAPAAFSVRPSERTRRWVPRLSGLLALCFLLLSLVRVAGLNRELRGLANLVQKVPAGADVRALLPESSDDSPWFGQDQLINTSAWITAERLGLVSDDHARFFQLPIVRARSLPFPESFRYVVSKRPGDKQLLRKQGVKGKPIAESDDWRLYEDPRAPPFELPFGMIVRYAQDWGALELDRAASKADLTIAGQRYDSGLGTHAHSLIQLRPRASGSLVGACGCDDAGEGQAEVICTVLDHQERVLHQAKVRRGAAAARFEVPVRSGESIFLQATTEQTKRNRDVHGAHVDWVELELRSH